MRILCLDGGSSSLKFTVYDAVSETHAPILAGEAAGFDEPPGRFRITSPSARPIDEQPPSAAPWNTQTALERIFRLLDEQLDASLSAVGHRIVFGGPNHFEPVRMSAEVLRDLERFVPLDPIHLRSQLDTIYAVARAFPQLPQVLCFDTAFHRRMPAIAKRLPLPRAIGPTVQRYGFHGLSYEYVLWKLAGDARGRVVIAHLGSGASLCAVKDGVPQETTMGFSPLGGLMMSTRPGDLDPGVLLYLLGPGGYDPPGLTELLTRRAGLLGVSESTASMEKLIAASATDPRASEAVELFVHHLIKQLGAMVAVLGGLDMLVFTAGIGEHAPQIRSAVCEALGFLGLRLDEGANATNAALISRSDSRVVVRIVPTDENLMVARHTATVISREAHR